ncbi:MAG: hypothetical protein HN341_07545 [Verrucomicrobia bacterium]|jgi:hypothetical protein|nr:hypothetical protein [Verrucomicrobiota bacterium]
MDAQYQKATSESVSRTSTDGDFGSPQPDREQDEHTGLFPIPGNGRYSPGASTEEVIEVDASTTTMEFLRFLAKAKRTSIELVACDILEKQADHYREAWALFCAVQGPSVQHDPMDTDILLKRRSVVLAGIREALGIQRLFCGFSEDTLDILIEAAVGARASRAGPKALQDEEEHSSVV